MESIKGYDAYKTASPYDDREQREADILERNLNHCPFCLGQPFFEDDAHTTDVYVTCNCGASMRGRDFESVAAAWDTRPQLPIARNVVRSVPREIWTGW